MLAEGERTEGATCTATAETIATPGPGNGGGPDATAGNSLVNVQIGDVTVKLPVSVAAAICDVNVNVLARQLRTGEASCEASSSSEA